MKKTKKWLTEEEYSLIKNYMSILPTASNNQIAELAKRSPVTIGRIRGTKSLADYQNLMRTEYTKWLAKKDLGKTGEAIAKEATPSEEVTPVYTNKEVVSQLNTIITVLKSIEFVLGNK